MSAETDPSARLLQILEVERKELLSGQLESLPDFADEKVRLLGLLKSNGAPKERITEISNLARRNAALFRAAIDAIFRIQSLLGQGQPLQLYDSAGHRLAAGPASVNTSRKF